VSECPDENLLAAYADHCLTPEEQRQVERHLSECRACRQVIALVVKSKGAVPDPPTAKQ
jgi:anti-sigma factor RsiW